MIPESRNRQSREMTGRFPAREVSISILMPLIRVRDLGKSFPTKPKPNWALRRMELDAEVGGVRDVHGAERS